MGINMDMDELLVKGEKYGLIKYKEQIYMINLKCKKIIENML